jgi:hypothetical protein
MKILNILQKKLPGESNSVEGINKHRLRLKNPDMNLYSEPEFLNFLRLEKKRSNRSRRLFMLVVIELKGFSKVTERREIVKDITAVLSSKTRDIDMKGWYKDNEAIGIIFSEIDSRVQNCQAGQQYILNKVWESLIQHLGLVRFDKLEISYQIFPGDFVVLPRANPGNLSQHPNSF